MSTLYDVLGVQRTATTKEIRKAYHQLAMRYHPDKLHSSTTDSMFFKIVDAFTVLSNEVHRSSYDNELSLQESTSVKDSARKSMIEKLNLRQSAAVTGDHLKPYKDDLEEALSSMSSEKSGRSFEDYEKIILSAYRKTIV